MKPVKSGKWEITVGEALRWSDKHQKLEGEGVRVVHIKQLLATHRQQIIREVAKMPGIKRGKWLIHPDWVSRTAVISKIKGR